MRKHHVLKIHPDFFDAVQDGSKTFELRRDDRDFQPHDTLEIREFSEANGGYTGRAVKSLHITYVLRAGDMASLPAKGLVAGWCIFAFERDK